MSTLPVDSLPHLSVVLPTLAQTTWQQWALVGVAATLALTGWRVLYNLFLHPLRDVPGPVAWRATSIPWALALATGQLPRAVLALHERYGPSVRVRPGEVSFATAQAWRDIYGHQRAEAVAARAGIREFPKSLFFYRVTDEPDNGHSIITAPREKHSALRSALSHGFSDRSMRAQEATIMGFVDKLIVKLREQAEARPGQAVDMTKWYNFTTFDVISELVFGETFGCLDAAELHPLPQLIFKLNTETNILRAVRSVGLVSLGRMLARVILPGFYGTRAFNRGALESRLGMGEERDHDLVEGMMRSYRKGVRDGDDTAITMSDIGLTVNTLVFAGSETTATLLSAVTYLLLSRAECLGRAAAEVRSAFASEDEITIAATSSRLPYMLACLNEALRRYPPVAAGLPRVVTRGGATVDGLAVPEGTYVSVTQLAASHASFNWTDPLEFRPERFLSEGEGGGEGGQKTGQDARYRTDSADAMQPFSLGPRNCIGKNLAYAEMRLILAKVLYNFDLELEEDSGDWIEKSRPFLVWEKPALNVQLRPRAAAAV